MGRGFANRCGKFQSNASGLKPLAHPLGYVPHLIVHFPGRGTEDKVANRIASKGDVLLERSAE